MKEFENSEIEIYVNNEGGYEPTMHYGEWRVAIMNCSDMWDKVKKYERHLLTDEVFVLLEGKASLLVGEERKLYKMEKNKIYNIKKGVWHGAQLSPDAKVLIVENHNTSSENTEKILFDGGLEIEL